MRFPAGGLGRAREKVAGGDAGPGLGEPGVALVHEGRGDEVCRPRRTDRQAHAEVNDPTHATQLAQLGPRRPRATPRSVADAPSLPRPEGAPYRRIRRCWLPRTGL